MPLQATILLAVNVAFLAIPSIDTSATDSTPGHFIRNPAQITSYISIIFSINCMIISLLLFRYHVVRPSGYTEAVSSTSPTLAVDSESDFLSLQYWYTNSYYGLKPLVILYNLPHTFLLWASVHFHCQTSFTVTALISAPDSIASFCFAFIFAVIVDSRGNWERYFLAVLIGICSVPVLWSFWWSWKGRSRREKVFGR